MAKSTSAPIPGTSTASFGAAPTMPRLGRLGTAPASVQLRTLEGKFSSGVGVRWTGLHEVERLFNVAAKIPERTSPEIMRELGEKAITYAKEHARWEDETGMARGLGAPNTDVTHLHYGLVNEANKTVSLYLAHGPEYGTYLEANPDLAILAEALLYAAGLAGEVSNRQIKKTLGALAR